MKYDSNVIDKVWESDPQLSIARNEFVYSFI
jgi:hypothetical protein